MQYYAGPRWVGGEVRDEAWLAAEGGRIVDEGHGRAPKAAAPAVLLDGLYNHHTHIGDAFLAGEELPRNLAELVAPGTGLKQRRLASTEPATVREAMRRQLEAYARVGVSAVVDFREQGAPGVRLAREANQPPRVRLHLLGRPTQPTAPGEVEAILESADGIGVPSLTDWGLDACAAMAEAARRRGRAFALHASEAEAEPMEDILSLHPDLLVHLGAATRADLRLVGDAGVPVVVCPSSNEFFEVPCAAERLAAMGIEWYLGTDNAMLGGVDPVDEARRLAGRHPDLDVDELFRALTTPPEEALGVLRSSPDDQGGPGRVRVLLRGQGDGVRWDAEPIVLERTP